MVLFYDAEGLCSLGQAETSLNLTHECWARYFPGSLPTTTRPARARAPRVFFFRLLRCLSVRLQLTGASRKRRGIGSSRSSIPSPSQWGAVGALGEVGSPNGCFGLCFGCLLSAKSCNGCSVLLSGLVLAIDQRAVCGYAGDSVVERKKGKEKNEKGEKKKKRRKKREKEKKGKRKARSH